MAALQLEEPCSIAVQFSLVLQQGYKSFYFPQAVGPVLYSAHHLIKESKVTGLVKVILPPHVLLVDTQQTGCQHLHPVQLSTIHTHRVPV